MQKNKTQSFKALDQTLHTQSRETGEKEAILYQCLDMNKAVPNLMGVSKARSPAQATAAETLPVKAVARSPLRARRSAALLCSSSMMMQGEF